MNSEPVHHVRVSEHADVGEAEKWIQTCCPLVMKKGSKPERCTAGDSAGSQRVSGLFLVTIQKVESGPVEAVSEVSGRLGNAAEKP